MCVLSYLMYRVTRNDCRGDQMLLAWPPCSPRATPCDFFLWGYVKDQVYVPPLPASIPEMKVVTCYKHSAMNSIIMFMFVESQRVHI